MIRPKWPSSQATASSIRQCAGHYRSFKSSSSAAPPEKPDGQNRRGQEQQKKQPLQWPGLKRRTPSSFDQTTAKGPNTLGGEKHWNGESHLRRRQRPSLNKQIKSILADETTTQPDTRAVSPRSAQNTSEFRQRQSERRGEINWEALDQDAIINNSKKNMLIFMGLSKNLVASDFYRLSPESQSLSSWGSTIKKVQQRRDRWTLEPTGTYHVSFSTSEAAAAYHDRILWLHQLAKAKNMSQNGLWTATLPQQLDMPNVDPAKELESFSLLPSSQDLHVTRARTSQRPWEKYLEEIITKDFGPKPAAVLVHADPPDLAPVNLHKAILRDGDLRDALWKTSFPVSLLSASSSSSTSKTTSKLEKHILQSLRGRFVLAFSNEWEARRFQRSWNQQRVDVPLQDGDRSQHILSVSFINW